MDRNDFQQLADLRIEEARILLDRGKWDGAYYLAGYAVECALKACIAKRTKEFDFPDKEIANKVFTHDVLKLINELKIEAALLADPDRKRKWSVVENWDESSRYERKTLTDAQELFDAITDPTGGILPWLKSYW